MLDSGMTATCRSIFAKLMLALRLAVVLSIAGYSTTQANEAMHSTICGSDVSVSHSHASSDASHSSGKSLRHVHADVDLAEDGNADFDQSDCCKSFCSSSALLTAEAASHNSYISMSHVPFIEQQLIPAGLATIHNPPNA